MSNLTLRVRNFRALRELEWTPRGVCVLTGANGAGKSTVLAALKFLRNTVLRGPQEASRFADAGSAFRNLASSAGEDVVFEITHEGWRWRLGIPVEGQGVHSYHEESLWRGGACVLDVPRLQHTFQLQGAVRGRMGTAEIHSLHAVHPDEALGRFIDVLRALRVYDNFDLGRAYATKEDTDGQVFLLPSGTNLVAVLNNWRSAPRRFNGQFEWVMRWTRRAFPDLIEDLEFTPEGQARFYPPGAPSPDASLPLSVAASGLITALHQLTAVAGAPDGSVIAFDEMENQLHPHAIRTVLAAMRQRADERGLTIILTTHAPIVLNAFASEPGQVFVLGAPGEPGVNPAPLDTLRDPEWLSMFALGDLYERNVFAAPAGAAAPPEVDP
jgi:predicted ATPase